MARCQPKEMQRRWDTCQSQQISSHNCIPQRNQKKPADACLLVSIAAAHCCNLETIGPSAPFCHSIHPA